MDNNSIDGTLTENDSDPGNKDLHLDANDENDETHEDDSRIQSYSLNSIEKLH